MKKGFLFLILFLLIIGAVIFYKKNLSSLQKLSFPKEKIVNQTSKGKEESTDRAVSQGLTLEIYQPKDKTVVNSSTINVSGKTSGGADVFINEKELKADSQGNFSTVVNLDEGENIITVVVSDDQGNYAEKELTVTLETIK